jgi:nitrogen fixation/metabolism regulation signal transduction histidine kinase
LEGRPDPRIDISTCRYDPQAAAQPGSCNGASGGDQVLIQVADNGPGFEAEIKDRAFEPYVTSKSKGTGLGLAIVKKIIEEHGGMIIAENTGSGAILRVRLPVWQASPHAAA